MKTIKLYEAFVDALKFIQDNRRGECNLYEIWTKLGGKFNWCNTEVDLESFTRASKPNRILIPVVINQDYDNYQCFLRAISIKDGNLIAAVILETPESRKIKKFPLEEVNLDRSQETLFFSDKPSKI